MGGKVRPRAARRRESCHTASVDRERRRRLNGVVAIVFGVVFALEAVLSAPGVAFAVTAVLAGACYSLISVLNR